RPQAIERETALGCVLKSLRVRGGSHDEYSIRISCGSTQAVQDSSQRRHEPRLTSIGLILSRASAEASYAAAICRHLIARAKAGSSAICRMMYSVEPERLSVRTCRVLPAKATVWDTSCPSPAAYMRSPSGRSEATV